MRKLLLLIVLLSLVAVWPAAAQDDPCFDKGGWYDAATDQCKVSMGFTINVDYPMAVIGAGEIETEVDTFVADQRTQFIGWFNEAVDYPMIAPWELLLLNDMTTTGYGLNTLRFTIYDYTGGAHGNTTFKTFLYDATTGVVYGFDALWQDGVDPMPTLSTLVQSQLLASIGDMTDADWIASGTGENRANYQNFVLTDTELVFIFPPYQVAAYAAGPQEARIPLAELTDLLNPMLVPSDTARG